MQINEEVIKSKWQQLKGEVQKAWGRLTSDELDQSQGDVNALHDLVNRKYGESREEFEKKMANITDRYKEPMDRTEEEMTRKSS